MVVKPPNLYFSYLSNKESKRKNLQDFSQLQMTRDYCRDQPEAGSACSDLGNSLLVTQTGLRSWHPAWTAAAQGLCLKGMVTYKVIVSISEA